MAPSGMLRRVALLRTVFSDEFIASIVRATRISELGTLGISSQRALVDSYS
jgi:hypothetical protein